MTHYEVLGVSRTADPDVIHAAYRALARKYHPDNQTTGNEKKFKAITLAHEVLTDKHQRRVYDGSIVETAPPRRKKASVMPAPEATINREPYQDPREAMAAAAKQYASNVIDNVIDEFLRRR